MIAKGFTFDGVHSSDMGLTTELVSIPLRSEPKTIYADVSGRYGELDLSYSNPEQRLYYRPRIIEFMCHCRIPDDTSQLNELSIIADYLFKKGDKKLFLDGDEHFYYKAHVANLFNVTYETEYSFSFPLIFKCDPFLYTAHGKEYEEAFVVEAENDGYYADPVIEVYGTAPNGFVLESDRFPDKSLTVNVPINQNTVIIDREKMDVTINGVSCLSQCRGDFFEIAPGENRISVDGDSAELRLKVTFDTRQL